MRLVLALLLLTGSLYSAIPVTDGLVLHLDSNQGVTLNGGKVETWADQSSSGADCTQATADDRPGYTANAYDGRPSIDFASTDFLQNVSDLAAIGTGDRTVMILQDPFDTADSEVVFSLGYDDTNGEKWAFTDTSVFGKSAGFDQIGLTSFGNLGSTTPQVHTWSSGTATDNNLNRWTNKTQKTTNNATSAWNTGDGYWVGGWLVSNNRPFVGAVYEIAVWNKILSTSERESVVDYFLAHPAASTNTRRGIDLDLDLDLSKVFRLFTSTLHAAPPQSEKRLRNIQTLRINDKHRKMREVWARFTPTPTQVPRKRGEATVTPTVSPTVTPTVTPSLRRR